MRVLITDDEALVSSVIQDRLEKMGHVVVGRAVDGQQAIGQAHSLQSDVILIDIAMSELVGLETSRQIQKQRPTPVVLLTAHENPELIAQASQVGVDVYLVKPPDGPEMVGAMAITRAHFADLLEQRRLNTALQEALPQVKTLSGLLPICASCKKIRDDQGCWQQVEVYIQTHSSALFTHDLCPECIEKLYPDLYEQVLQRQQDIAAILTRRGQADLQTIAAEVGLPESNTLNRLKDLVAEGQIECVESEAQTLYELKNQ